MEKKTDTVRRLVMCGEYRKALRIAKDFRLGIRPEDREAMRSAYECWLRPEFFRQLDIDTDAAVATGVLVLKRLYGKEG